MAWSDTSTALTPEFRRNRPLVLQRDRGQCRLRYDGCAGEATEVDHIKNRAEGGDDSMENLQSVCPHCHTIKTRREWARARRRSREAARHPWTRLKHPGLK
ncbi:HNH endonuclease [Gordonia phage Daredevil]|uniref:HNH endonuclease n=1 Tax=Gordonia phage Daredevil TaxID=2283286 RepID=A0A345MIL7_9CAUD|nr:HNH endonuclease [Gordonia phage Daredevil]AXH70398.1 HNH endonuclease [Gordonia phage Daredevil]